MSDTPNASASATISLPLATLAVVFLAVAKIQDLWGLGDLSWWWVFAPYWLGFVLFLAVLLFIGVIFGAGAGIVSLIDRHDRKKREKARQERLNKRI